MKKWLLFSLDFLRKFAIMWLPWGKIGPAPARAGVLPRPPDKQKSLNRLSTMFTAVKQAPPVAPNILSNPTRQEKSYLKVKQTLD